MNTFEEWFESQFGKRPHSNSIFALEEEKQKMESELVKHKKLIQEVRLWEGRHYAANLAWQAAADKAKEDE